MSVNKKRKALLQYKKKMKQHTAASVQTVFDHGSTAAAAARSDVQEVKTMKDGETTLGTSSYTSFGTTSPSDRRSHPTNVHLQVITKHSISKLVKERCDSVNLTMKMIERCPDAHDKRIDAEVQMELERIDGRLLTCFFLHDNADSHQMTFHLQKHGISWMG